MTVLQPLVLSSQSVCINLLHHMFVFVLVAVDPCHLSSLLYVCRVYRPMYSPQTELTLRTSPNHRLPSLCHTVHTDCGCSDHTRAMYIHCIAGVEFLYRFYMYMQKLFSLQIFYPEPDCMHLCLIVATIYWLCM